MSNTNTGEPGYVTGSLPLSPNGPGGDVDIYQMYMDKWQCTRKEAKRTAMFYVYGEDDYMDTVPFRDTGGETNDS